MVTSFLILRTQSILIVFLHYTLHVFDVSCSHNSKTPLLCAAETGHDEVMAYLLEFENVLTDLRGQPDVVESASVS